MVKYGLTLKNFNEFQKYSVSVPLPQLEIKPNIIQFHQILDNN